MLKNIRDITIVTSVGLAMLVALLIFFMVTLDAKGLTVERFETGQESFQSSSIHYEKNSKLYEAYDNSKVLEMDVDKLASMRTELEIKESQSTDYLISSDEQISDYAKVAYDYAQKQYSEEKFRLIDTVYTAPAKYYAYLSIPQNYLMFMMSEDESKMMAFIYQPTKEGYEITELWSISESDDLELVETYTQNILVKYYEKVM